MDAKPGDLITVEAQHVGQPMREGEILEVIQGPVAVSYRVKWRDGHETMLTPAAGAARLIPKPSRRPIPMRLVPMLFRACARTSSSPSIVAISTASFPIRTHSSRLSASMWYRETSLRTRAFARDA